MALLGREFVSFEIVGEHSVLPEEGAEYYLCAEMIRGFEIVRQEHTVLPYGLKGC